MHDHVSFFVVQTFVQGPLHNCGYVRSRLLSRANQIEGQMNLKDAVRRNISFIDSKSGKSYELKSKASLSAKERKGSTTQLHLQYLCLHCRGWLCSRGSCVDLCSAILVIMLLGSRLPFPDVHCYRLYSLEKEVFVLTKMSRGISRCNTWKSTGL